MRIVILTAAAIAGLSFAMHGAAALEITQAQADGACNGSKDGNGDTACTKCGTINDHTCAHVVVYQCEHGRYTTTVYRNKPSTFLNTGIRPPMSGGLLKDSAQPSSPRGPASTTSSLLSTASSLSTTKRVASPVR